jgi:hypothetical protein
VTRNRVIVAFGVVLFLVLAGTGTANALWTSLTGASGTVTAGRISVAQTGFDDLAVEYNSSTTQKVAPVTVTNTGTVLFRYSLQLSGSTTNNTIASSASVQTRTVGSAADCTATTVSNTYKWTTIPAVTGMLDPGASVVVCVQSTMTAAQVTANNGKSMEATLALSATSSGSWATSASDTTTQSARIPLPGKPSTPVASDTSGYSTTLTWSDGATSSNSATTSYNVYRNGNLLASNVKSPYVDTSATRNTTYSYTVEARDAAGHTTQSAAVSVRTLNITPSTWYTISPSSRSSVCIDVVNGSTRNGSGLELATCDSNAAQAWAFVQNTDGTYRVAAGHVNSSGWFGSAASGYPAQLSAYSSDAANKWRAVAVGSAGTTTFQFVNEATDRCLDLTGSSTSNGTRLIQSTCRTSTDARTQAFTIKLR